ncbi:hypothetical protein CEP52_003201 [Fusarium oligoseptatum]|uniref:Nephrocystin 3-like N-terminal domain-containing protein n=1 Tax=Fusarium oligoseptatum TaxID=2604345 RepID=A0A428U9H4_9HYPO|nr:hypothetical protein CEP52_003201 [Fusarium oligoseptatum]
MEPLAAVALAGNVLQFAEFVGRLFKNASKIYESASGLTPNDLHIQDICDKLGSFSGQLQVTSSTPNAQPDKDLQACVAACKKDCDDLLSIMKALATKKGKSRKFWKSFSVALSHKLKETEIEELKGRIQDHQGLISIQLSKMLNERVRATSSDVSQLQSTIKDWTTKTTALFKKLSGTQRDLSEKVQELNQKIAMSNHQESIPCDAIASICSRLRGLSIDTQDCRQTMHILNSLDYEERPMRHNNIPQAHQATFTWGLQQDNPGESQGPSGSFCRWLSGDSNLFWVSGKPGSGKSTFMKFVAGHMQTQVWLRQWAGHGELILARHFFTIYGTAIQRSLEGLLRSLLHNILEGESELVQKLLPARWASTSKQPPWTHSELESTLRAVANTNLPAHICFFIDGLDEYAGDHLEICQMLKELSESRFIKVCVSSRPWNVFEDAFGNSRESKLYIHELTHEDILNYTQARLSEHPRWSFVSSGPDATASQSLIKEVVDKSMGVFLWVFLVTKYLREGLSNDDSFSDLRKRVSSYPDDLDKFFKQILESVDPFYNQKMASTLMIARDAGEPLATEMFMFHDYEYDDEDYALRSPTDQEWLDNNCREASSSVSRRINGRTVFDFLRTSEMVKFLREKAKTNFCSHLSLLRAWLAWFKRTVVVQISLDKGNPDFMENSPEVVQSLREGIQYACMASSEGGDTEVAVTALLDNAELEIRNMVRTSRIMADDESTAVGIYRLLLLESGIGGYLESRLSKPEYLSNPYTDNLHSPLCFVVGMIPAPSGRDSFSSNAVNRLLLEKLLKSGCDPNKAYGDDTFWTRFVKFYTCNTETSPISEKSAWTRAQSRVERWAPEQPLGKLAIAMESGILEVLLRYGADPAAYIPLTHQQRVPFWFHLLLLGPEITARVWPAYERVWALVLERIPALSQVKFLNRFWEARRAQKLKELRNLRSDLAQDEGLASSKLPQSNRLLTEIFSRIVHEVRNDDAALGQCLDWFAPWLSSMRLEEPNSRKRLMEEGEEEEEEREKAAKARRLT